MMVDLSDTARKVLTDLASGDWRLEPTIDNAGAPNGFMMSTGHWPDRRGYRVSPAIVIMLSRKGLIMGRGPWHHPDSYAITPDGRHALQAPRGWWESAATP